jgi:hypothetical protein
MRPLSLISRSILVAPLLLALFAAAPAGAIDVYPRTHHFGEVAVGTSSSTVITLVNDTGHSHDITTVALSPESSPDFSLTTVLDLPMTLPAMSRLELEIVFTPTTPALSVADLIIHSIDSSLKIVIVSLQGGIGTPPPPGVCSPWQGQ